MSLQTATSTIRLVSPSPHAIQRARIKAIKIDIAKRVVCNPDDVLRRGMLPKPIAMARAEFCYCLSNELGMSLSEIATFYGHRDHCTVSSFIRRYKAEVLNDEVAMKRIEYEKKKALAQYRRDVSSPRFMPVQPAVRERFERWGDLRVRCFLRIEGHKIIRPKIGTIPLGIFPVGPGLPIYFDGQERSTCSTAWFLLTGFRPPGSTPVRYDRKPNLLDSLIWRGQTARQFIEERRKNP